MGIGHRIGYHGSFERYEIFGGHFHFEISRVVYGIYNHASLYANGLCGGGYMHNGYFLIFIALFIGLGAVNGWCYEVGGWEIPIHVAGTGYKGWA
jgi:hypothetical protein